MREVHRLRVFENRILRRISGSKRDVNGEWKRFHNEEFLSILTGKRPLGRPRHRREDNIKMDLKKMGVNTSNWADSAQDMKY